MSVLIESLKLTLHEAAGQRFVRKCVRARPWEERFVLYILVEAGRAFRLVLLLSGTQAHLRCLAEVGAVTHW